MVRGVNDSYDRLYTFWQNVEDKPNWKNIKLFHEIKPEEIIKMKEQEGKDFTILGSGTIVQQFANLGLIDEYQLVIVPVILGAGKYLFKDVIKMNLKLLEEKRNGNDHYIPAIQAGFHGVKRRPPIPKGYAWCGDLGEG